MLATEDRNRYSAHHYETFCDIIAAYHLLVQYSPTSSVPPVSIDAKAIPSSFLKRLATLHKKFVGTGKRLSDWPSLVDQGLAHIRSVNEVLGAKSSAFQSTGPLAGIRNMRNLGRMSAGLGVAENFLYAGFHVLFLLKGSCTNLNACPDIRIPSFPSNVDRIIAETERTTGGNLDDGDKEYLRELFTQTSTSAFEVKLPLLLSLAASPAVLNLPFRISKSGASKSTVTLLSAFRGNNKPSALQQTEDILWPMLKDFFQCQEPLFAVLHRACESFPWEGIRASTDEERTWVDPGIPSKDAISTLQPTIPSTDATLSVTVRRELRKRKDRSDSPEPDCPASDDARTRVSSKRAPLTESTRTLQPHLSTAPRRSPRGNKRAKARNDDESASQEDESSSLVTHKQASSSAPLEFVQDEEGEALVMHDQALASSSGHRTLHDAALSPQPLHRSSSESTIQTQHDGSLEDTSFTIRESSFDSRTTSPHPTTLSGLDASGDVKVIVNPPTSPIQTDSSTPPTVTNHSEFDLIGSQKLPIDVDQLDRYRPSLTPLLENNGNVIEDNDLRFFPFTANGLGPDFSVQCHSDADKSLVTNVIYQVESLYDATGDLSQLRSQSPRDIQSTLRRWWINGHVSVEPTLAAFLNEIEPFGNTVEIHDQSISVDPHVKAAICHGTVDQIILTKLAKEKMKVLSVSAIPSRNTDPYDPLYASETWAYFATHARRTSLRWKPSPAQALSFNGVALKGAVFPFQIPPDGFGVVLTVRMGDLFTVLCRPEREEQPLDELARPDYLMHLDPYHSVIGSSEYEGVLLTSGNTGYCSIRVTVDIGTSINSRHYLCRMMMFWYDVLVDGKHNGSNTDDALRHVPTLDSFESVLDLLALVSLSMFANVLDQRTYSMEEVPRHDRALYIAARRAAMLTVKWFFATYDLFDLKIQSDIDGYAEFWYPMLGMQATALLQFKFDADQAHRFDPRHSRCSADQVRQQLQYVVDIYPLAGDHFNAHPSPSPCFEPLTYLTSVSKLVYEVRKRSEPVGFYQNTIGLGMPEPVQNQTGVRVFDLYGVDFKGNFVDQEDEQAAMPSEIEKVNFARLKITDSLQQWAESEKDNQPEETGPTGRSSSTRRTRASLTREEALASLYTTILSKYAMEDESGAGGVEHHPSLEPKETRVAQAAELMLTGVAEGTGKTQLSTATNVVAAVKPYNWPLAVIANQMLVMRSILFDLEGDDYAGYDPQAGRMFYDEEEVEKFFSCLLKIARTTHGAAIESTLKRFCTSRRDGDSISAGSRPVADWEFQNASELLSFLSPHDEDICLSTLLALGSFSMPLDAIRNTIMKLITVEGPTFYVQAKNEVLKRVDRRKTPLSFPVRRTQPIEVESTPRTPSPALPDRPSVPKREPTSPAPVLGWQPADEQPLSAVAPHQGWQNAAGRSISPIAQGWQNPQQEANGTYPVTPAFESLMAHLQVAAAAHHQPLAQPPATAPSQQELIVLRSTAPNPVRSHNPSILKVGNGPGTFKWWNIAVNAPVSSPEDLKLSHQPAPGDVLTWFNPATTNSIGIFTFTDMGWLDVTRSYCGNEGNIFFPGSVKDRILTWKSEEMRTPTWVMDKTFKRDKKFVIGDELEYPVFIKHFATAGGRGSQPLHTPSPSAGPSTGVAT
ncbi:hypothetical protein MD484_g5230, partial [Candolleomyces efflorescens]